MKHIMVAERQGRAWVVRIDGLTVLHFDEEDSALQCIAAYRAAYGLPDDTTASLFCPVPAAPAVVSETV